MIKSIVRSGFNLLTKTPKPAKAPSLEKLTRSQRILVAANGVLYGKSNRKYSLNFASYFEHPHMFGCYIDSGPNAVKGALKYASDIEDALSRSGYLGQVLIRLAPLRLEVINPDPPKLPFRNYWDKIAESPQNTYSFNGVLLYQGAHERKIGFSLAKPEFPHVGFFGASGSGKTVLLYNAILSLCMNTSPELISLVLCDKAGSNLHLLDGLPHMATPTCVHMLDIEQAVGFVAEELRRRNLAQDKSLARQRIVLVVDEFNNVLDAAPDILGYCTKIAREGRQFGIHLFAAGQKLAGSKTMDPEFYQNLALRFVGSTGGNKAEALINSGDGSIADKLPTAKGIFELRASGPILGEQTPIVVRSMFIEKPERDIPWYVDQIRRRWGGAKPHWNVGGWRRMDKQPKPEVDPTLRAVVLQRAQSEKMLPSVVIRIAREWTGKDITFPQAHRLLADL
jgi:hypothetical protein